MNIKDLRRITLTFSTHLLLISTKWLSTPLPFRLQLKLWGSLAVCFYHVSRRYRHICMTNLRRCFPEKTEVEVKILCRETFYSFGMGVAEALAAWQMNTKRFKKIKFQVYGLENLEVLRSQKKKCHCLFRAFFFNRARGKKNN